MANAEAQTARRRNRLYMSAGAGDPVEMPSMAEADADAPVGETLQRILRRAGQHDIAMMLAGNMPALDLEAATEGGQEVLEPVLPSDPWSHILRRLEHSDVTLQARRTHEGGGAAR